MVWVRAGTAGELASLMQAADARLPPGEDQARRRPAAGGAPASRRLGQAGGFGMPNGRPHQPGNAVGASWEAPTWAVRDRDGVPVNCGKTGRGDGDAVTFAAVARLVGMAVHTTPKWNVLCAAVG